MDCKESSSLVKKYGLWILVSPTSLSCYVSSWYNAAGEAPVILTWNCNYALELQKFWQCLLPYIPARRISSSKRYLPLPLFIRFQGNSQHSSGRFLDVVVPTFICIEKTSQNLLTVHISFKICTSYGPYLKTRFVFCVLPTHLDVNNPFHQPNPPLLFYFPESASQEKKITLKLQKKPIQTGISSRHSALSGRTYTFWLLLSL